MLNRDVTWAKFEENNPNVDEAFEDMCGMLFFHSFCSKQSFMHANHNNPGVEIEPILSKDGKTRISYQAKYLTETDYSKFQKSAEMTVKHYAGKLDVVYMYCNRNLTTTSQGYKKIEKTLEGAGMKLIPITNRAIINEVLEYQIVANAFFNIPMLNEKWFATHLKGSLESLGVRYNRNFNVETEMDQYLHLFLGGSQAVKIVNDQKKNALDSVANYQRYNHPYIDYIDKAWSIIYEIPDVEENTLLDCLKWENYLAGSLKDELAKIQEDIDQRNKLQCRDFGEEKDYYENLREIQKLEELLEIPLFLEIGETERSLLKQRMVIVHGRKGVGKSQLLANTSQAYMKEDFPVVLILGGTFLGTNVLLEQIPSVLGIEYNMDMLLSALERKANASGKYAVIFIDAINESGNPAIWKEGIRQLYQKLDQFLHVKICISYTSGYEKIVLDEAVCTKIMNGEIISVEHKGFDDEPIEAARQFLDNYNIPFYASYILQSEMINPLFLTLFCKTYFRETENFKYSLCFKRLLNKRIVLHKRCWDMMAVNLY